MTTPTPAFTHTTNSTAAHKGRVRSALTGLLAGSFLANGIPHLFFALTGHNHATPFGADSSATINLIWGTANVAFGLALALPNSNRQRVGLFAAAAALGAAGTAASLAIMWV